MNRTSKATLRYLVLLSIFFYFIYFVSGNQNIIITIPGGGEVNPTPTPTHSHSPSPSPSPTSSPTPTGTARTVCVLYGVANPNVGQVAAFDAFICDFHNNYVGGFNIAPVLNQVKQQNPDLETYGYMEPPMINTIRAYYSTVNSHEEWFIHRTDNGQRVYDEGWGQYLLDVRNQAYREFFVSWTNSKINDPALSEPFTGVLFDYFNLGLDWVVPGKQNVVPAEYWNNFHTYMLDFLTYVAPRIDGKIVINTDEGWGSGGHDYLAKVDGQMIERFGHPAFANIYNDAGTNTAMLATMDYAKANGKSIYAVGGADQATPDPTIDRFCYAMFMLGSYDNAFFGIAAQDAYYDHIVTDPITETTLGSALGARYNDGSWIRRNFQYGYVRVNLNSPSSEVILE